MVGVPLFVLPRLGRLLEVVSARLHGGRLLGRRGGDVWVKKNACESMVVKQKTEIELREGDDY